MKVIIQASFALISIIIFSRNIYSSTPENNANPCENLPVQVKKEGTFVSTKKKGQVFLPEGSGDRYLHYECRGYEPKLGFFIFLQSGYEWGQFLLIDEINGDQFPLIGSPTVSPDGKRIFAYEDSGGYSSPTFSIYKVIDRKIELEWNHEFQRGDFSDAKWVDDKKVQFVKAADGDGINAFMNSQVVITLTPSGWKMEEIIDPNSESRFYKEIKKNEMGK